MGNDYFQFKQFTVRQPRAAMKVGTDGVLLGTLGEGGRHILDIGAGTGVVSLMFAQRFPDARVTAIEIDENAYLDASGNFDASPFAERLTLVKGDFRNICHDDSLWADGGKPIFDSIVSNPPYFDDSFENPDEGRTRARHTSSLSFHDLVSGAYFLLTEGGVFSVSIPVEALKQFMAECLITGFCLKHSHAIKTVPRKSPKRFILVFQKGGQCESVEETFCLLNADGTRSDWYQDLMKDFYL
ncbi:MAG: methyltransferase [Bacteroidales bacterium]|nr:methyltransferase [Bacteroidales bacterium]MCM1147913.1 methyltransferase [Bacteroidales bacterium]MCM1205462.1 methyltransferase [Bacillota bacterium]MCM1509276.1 methyltransferase [Clostridium sp.]